MTVESVTGGDAATHSKGSRGSRENDVSERDRLLVAAKQVLQRSGWRFLKIDAVLRQAALSTRSFYRHFEQKSDLLLAVFEREITGQMVVVRRAMALQDNPTGRVAAYIDATVDTAYRENLVRPSSRLTEYWRELLPEYPEAIDRCNRMMIAPLIEAVEDGMRAGTFDSTDPEADAWAIFYLVGNISADQAAVGGRIPRERLEHIVLPFVARALGISLLPAASSPRQAMTTPG